MFTGLVERVGRVVAFERVAGGGALAIDAGPWPESPERGESISVSGCCLTLTSPPGERTLRFDVIAETLAHTTLGALRSGDRVNLERSVRPSTLMGGHVVQGHVDGVGEVVRVGADPRDWRIAIRPPVELADCIVPKGAITVDGVSLTIAAAGDDGEFEVALIPTTLEATTLGALRAGARCNLESDIVARTVVHWLRRRGAR